MTTGGLLRCASTGVGLAVRGWILVVVSGLATISINDPRWSRLGKPASDPPF